MDHVWKDLVGGSVHDVAVECDLGEIETIVLRKIENTSLSLMLRHLCATLTEALPGEWRLPETFV